MVKVLRVEKGLWSDLEAWRPAWQTLFLKGSPAAESLCGMVKTLSSGPRHIDSEFGEVGLLRTHVFNKLSLPDASHTGQ